MIWSISTLKVYGVIYWVENDSVFASIAPKTSFQNCVFFSDAPNFRVMLLRNGENNVLNGIVEGCEHTRCFLCLCTTKALVKSFAQVNNVSVENQRSFRALSDDRQ